jgi:hypothetical protein
MQKHAAPCDGDGEQSGVNKQEKAEQQPRTVAVRRHRAEIDRKQKRHRRCADRRVLKCGIDAGGFGRQHAPARDRKAGKPGERKDGEDPHPKRKRSSVEELEDPDPLVDRREHHRQGGQKRPHLTIGHPRQPDIQQHQVCEERDGPVLSG